MATRVVLSIYLLTVFLLFQCCGKAEERSSATFYLTPKSGTTGAFHIENLTASAGLKMLPPALGDIEVFAPNILEAQFGLSQVPLAIIDLSGRFPSELNAIVYRATPKSTEGFIRFALVGVASSISAASPEIPKPLPISSVEHRAWEARVFEPPDPGGANPGHLAGHLELNATTAYDEELIVQLDFAASLLVICSPYAPKSCFSLDHLVVDCNEYMLAQEQILDSGRHCDGDQECVVEFRPRCRNAEYSVNRASAPMLNFILRHRTFCDCCLDGRLNGCDIATADMLPPAICDENICRVGIR